MGSKQSQYDIGLDKNAANYVPLTPLSFLERSAAVYPNHVSTVYEDRSFTWAQSLERCRRFASYLAGKGAGVGDTVAAMLPNIPAMNELHFAVPMVGAVLNALNIRLDASSIAFQLDHGGAKIILVDPEFSAVITEALKVMSGPKPFVIDVDDAAYDGGQRIGWDTSLQIGQPGVVKPGVHECACRLIAVGDSMLVEPAGDRQTRHAQNGEVDEPPPATESVAAEPNECRQDPPAGQ